MSAFTWALLASLCWGFAPLFEKQGLRGATDPMIGVLIRSVGVLLGALGFLPMLPRWSHRFAAITGRQWIWLCLGGLTASIIGQLCFYRALKMGDVSRVVPVGASYPVIACLLGVLLLNEPISLPKTAGILLVVAGTYLLR